MQNPWTFFDPQGLSRAGAAGKKAIGNRITASGARASTAKSLGLAGASFVPGVGEALDLAVIANPNSSAVDKAIASVSLAINAMTGGFAPNAGGIMKGADEAADAVDTSIDTASGAMNSAEAGMDASKQAENVAENVGQTNKQGSDASQAAPTETANPQDIKFTQDSVSSNFSDGVNTLEGTTKQLKDGTITPNDLPPLNVVEHGGKLKSLDNRRLKALKDAGVTKTPVVKKSLSDPKVKKEFRRKNTTRNGGQSIKVRKPKPKRQKNESKT